MAFTLPKTGAPCYLSLMRFLFVMDPVETIIRDADTTFALMLAAEAAGIEVHHALHTDLLLEGKERYVHSSPVELSRDESKPPARLLESKRRLLSDFDALFIRKDPPFNEDYLWMSLLLSGIPEGERPFVINRPMGLRNANEKLYATHFPEVTPRTLVTGRKDEILRFLEAEGGAAVIKPIDGHGGEGVFKLASDDPNKNAIIEALTHNERRQVMVQEFLPEVKEGDKRILLIGDETLGAILRVPRSDDLRSNIHVGGSVVRASIDEADQKIIAAVRDRLRADGLYFVGLDVIGGKLTEVNVTSPTGIQQMTRLDGIDYSAKVIEWVKARISTS